MTAEELHAFPYDARLPYQGADQPRSVEPFRPVEMQNVRLPYSSDPKPIAKRWKMTHSAWRSSIRVIYWEHEKAPSR